MYYYYSDAHIVRPGGFLYQTNITAFLGTHSANWPEQTDVSCSVLWKREIAECCIKSRYEGVAWHQGSW